MKNNRPHILVAAVLAIVFLMGWHAGLRTNYYVTKHLRAALSVNYERLQTSVADSPLVKDDYVLGFFGGFAWTF